MAKILPFKAVRPTRDKVGLVASRSYQSYNKEQREGRLKYNPYSFLHIVNPGYKYRKELSGLESYKLVKNRYQEFKEEGVFIQEEQDSIYLYKIIDREQQEYIGIIALSSVEDYKNKIIKIHEKTLEKTENIFTKYLNTVGFNAEPVLITYPDNAVINSIITKVSKSRPEYEFATTQKDTHYLWVLQDKKQIQIIQQEFRNFDSLYIADGHHRSASSCALQQELMQKNPEHSGAETYNYFMSYLIAESQLKIFEFNRLVKDLNGLSVEEFLIAIDEYYIIEQRGKNYYKPQIKHHFSMYLDGSFYSLQLRKFNYSPTSPTESIDAEILYKTILKPILGITNQRNNKRLEYVHGKHDLTYITSKVDSNKFKVGFGLRPTTLNQIKKIANHNLTMPPKSTYIEPKLRSGITIYEY